VISLKKFFIISVWDEDDLLPFVFNYTTFVGTLADDTTDSSDGHDKSQRDKDGKSGEIRDRQRLSLISP